MRRRGRLMFNWKRYAGFSLICTRKCRLSPSVAHCLLFLLTSLSCPFFCLYKMYFFASCPPSLSSPTSSLIPFLWSFLPASQFFYPLSSDLLLCFSLMLECKSTYACALINASVLECHHICLLCEFDTSKGCHKLNKSIPCSVLHWQN